MHLVFPVTVCMNPFHVIVTDAFFWSCSEIYADLRTVPLALYSLPHSLSCSLGDIRASAVTSMLMILQPTFPSGAFPLILVFHFPPAPPLSNQCVYGWLIFWWQTASFPHHLYLSHSFVLSDRNLVLNHLLTKLCQFDLYNTCNPFRLFGLHHREN